SEPTRTVGPTEPPTPRGRATSRGRHSARHHVARYTALAFASSTSRVEPFQVDELDILSPRCQGREVALKTRRGKHEQSRACRGGILGRDQRPKVLEAGQVRR